MHWPILSTSCYVPVRFYTVRSRSGSKRFDSERASIAVFDSILCPPGTSEKSTYYDGPNLSTIGVIFRTSNTAFRVSDSSTTPSVL